MDSTQNTPQVELTPRQKYFTLTEQEYRAPISRNGSKPLLFMLNVSQTRKLKTDTQDPVPKTFLGPDWDAINTMIAKDPSYGVEVWKFFSDMFQPLVETPYRRQLCVTFEENINEDSGKANLPNVIKAIEVGKIQPLSLPDIVKEMNLIGAEQTKLSERMKNIFYDPINAGKSQDELKPILGPLFEQAGAYNARFNALEKMAEARKRKPVVEEDVD